MGWIRRFRNTLPGSRLDATFAEEARFHLEERNRPIRQQRHDARAGRERKARRRLGNLTLARETYARRRHAAMA